MFMNTDEVFVEWIARQHIGTVMPLINAVARPVGAVTRVVIEIESFFWARGGGHCYRGVV